MILIIMGRTLGLKEPLGFTQDKAQWVEKETVCWE